MSSANHPTDVIAYLLHAPLKHIVHLKALAAYSQHISSRYFSRGSAAGVLFVYPTRVTTYESVKYPQAGHVVLIASDSPSITELMLDDLPADGNFVLKLIGPDDQAVVARRFSLQRTTSFLSYTHPAETEFMSSERVTVSRRLDGQLLPFYRANGYERDEMEGYFNAGAAFSFALHEGGEPVCACMAYKNYGEIWEVCALYTKERARRNGYARAEVETALHTLRENGHVPRYQMDESNIASRELAQRLGLRRFLTTEHFLCRHAG